MIFVPRLFGIQPPETGLQMYQSFQNVCGKRQRLFFNHEQYIIVCTCRLVQISQYGNWANIILCDKDKDNGTLAKGLFGSHNKKASFRCPYRVFLKKKKHYFHSALGKVSFEKHSSAHAGLCVYQQTQTRPASLPVTHIGLF